MFSFIYFGLPLLMMVAAISKEPEFLSDFIDESGFLVFIVGFVVFMLAWPLFVVYHLLIKK